MNKKIKMKFAILLDICKLVYNNKKTIDFQLEICYHKTYISDKGTLLCNILNIIGKSIAHNLRL